MGLLEDASQWLADQRDAHTAQDVRYLRGQFEVTLAATIGRTVLEAEDARGVVHQYEARDFIVRASDLVLSGQQVEPARGDLIEEADGAVYAVEAPAGMQPFRFSDHGRTTMRIHTIRRSRT